MRDIKLNSLSSDEWDEVNGPRPEKCDFDRVAEVALSRREFLGGVVALGSGATAIGTGILNGTSAQDMATGRFGFTPIPIQTDHTVHVPEGYEWDIQVRWGDPLFSDAPDFDHSTGGSTQGADRIFGSNTDGMKLFLVDGRQVIAVNHESANRDINLSPIELRCASSGTGGCLSVRISR